MQRDLWSGISMISLSSFCYGHESHGLIKSWKLGPYDNPGFFDITDIRGNVPGEFAIASIFRLDWNTNQSHDDGIYNNLHSVTIGRTNQAGKTHLEQLAQILHGQLHITCRMQLPDNRIYRNTVAVPGDIKIFIDRWFLLVYTGHTLSDNPLYCYKTQAVLYDCETLDILQNLEETFTTKYSLSDIFGEWSSTKIVCDHEFMHVPRDHFLVHGSVMTEKPLFYHLSRIWGSFGNKFDALDNSIAAKFLGETVPDQIDAASAWYNSDTEKRFVHNGQNFSICTGRYHHPEHLGIMMGFD